MKKLTYSERCIIDFVENQTPQRAYYTFDEIHEHSWYGDKDVQKAINGLVDKGVLVGVEYVGVPAYRFIQNWRGMQK